MGGREQARMVESEGDHWSVGQGLKTCSESLASVRHYEYVDGMPLTKGDTGHQEKAYKKEIPP